MPNLHFFFLLEYDGLNLQFFFFVKKQTNKVEEDRREGHTEYGNHRGFKCEDILIKINSILYMVHKGGRRLHLSFSVFPVFVRVQKQTHHSFKLMQ